MTKNAKKETKELVYNVEKEIATISENGTAKKKLTYMSWGDNPAKYDLRTWVTKPDGTETPKKGITLDFAECKALCKALSEIKEETPKKTEKKTETNTAKKTTTAKKTANSAPKDVEKKAVRNTVSNKKIPDRKTETGNSDSVEMLAEMLLEFLTKSPDTQN